MSSFSLLIWLTLSQAPAVEIVTLSEKSYQGTLDSLSADSAIIKNNDGTATVRLDEILSIRSTVPALTPANEPYVLVRLVDGTQLRCRTFISSRSVMTVTHPKLGELKIPSSSVSSVRLAPPDSKIDAEWDQLFDRAPKKDMVAIRKGDVLDHLDGVIGTLNETTLQFQLDGDEIPVKREKIFGLIFSKREATTKKPIAQFDLTSGDRLSIKQISWKGNVWNVQLSTGLEVDVPSELFQTLDYSVSKITYLSDLEPRSIKHTPYFDIPDFHVFDYRRDRDFDGNRISLGHNTYAKGLAIHSRTQLKYRLGAGYRRFQSVMGIGDEINRGDVDVVIKADDKVVFSGSAKGNERGETGAVRRAAPQILDIDVTGVVELEIYVDFGSDKVDIGDRLYLANARVVR